MAESLAASVVVCTRDRADALAELLPSLCTQSVDARVSWELIVVDNGSRDRTPALVQQMREKTPVELRYLREEETGLSTARNRGWREARGDIVAFIDDDATAGPGWLQSLVDSYVESGVAGAGGPLVPLVEMSDGGPPDPAWVRLFSHDAGDEAIDVDALRGSNMSFRREVLARIGGFDESLGRIGGCLLAGDETDVLRAVRRLPGAHRIRYAPGAVVYHRVAPGLSAERLSKRRYCGGVSTVSIDRKDSAPQRLFQLARRHAALGVWGARALGRILRRSGPDLEQTARFQEFVGYYREWLGGPASACRDCPMFPERRALLERLSKRQVARSPISGRAAPRPAESPSRSFRSRA